MLFSLLMIVLAIYAYASDRIPMEVTSVLIIAALLLFYHFVPVVEEDGTVLLDMSALLMGFSNPALISVLSLLVLGQAIIQTGALNEVAHVILRVTRNHTFLAISMTLLCVGVISGVMNNTPVVVIFIPIMATLAKQMGLSVSRVMIPLSFVSILGGMTTLIGSSTNILVSGIMGEMGMEPLGFFDFIVPGVFMALAGFVYVVVVVPRILPDRASLARSFREEDAQRQFVAQVMVEYGSDFVGKKLESGALEHAPDLAVRMVQRGEHAFLPPFDESIVLRPQDILVLSAGKKELAEFFAQNPDSLERHLARLGEGSDSDEELGAADINMAEVVVAPASKMIGRTLEQIGFHRQFDCVVLGIQRQSRNIRARATEIRLAAGDVLLVMGRPEDIMQLHESRDFLLMEWSSEAFHSGSKAKPTLAIFGAVVGLAALEVVPIAIGAFAGVGAMLLVKSLTINQAVRALDLNIMLMVAASLALGTALQATGGARFLAHGLIVVMGGADTLWILAALFLLMMLLTNVLSNNAAAVLFVPIAVNVAQELGADPTLFIFAVIFACNCSFVTPIGYQTNLMVMGPGHYKFADFMRAGLPLALIIWVVYLGYAYMVLGGTG